MTKKSKKEVHDDSTCEGLHLEASFTFTVFKETKGSKNLLKWFNKVFLKQNPTLKHDFELEFAEGPEGGIFLEIHAFNQNFTVQALLSLYTAWEDSKYHTDEREYLAHLDS